MLAWLAVCRLAGSTATHARGFPALCPLPPQVAGSPELYPVLVDGPALPTLLGLLAHDNADLAAEVVDLIMELTDAGVWCACVCEFVMHWLCGWACGGLRS